MGAGPSARETMYSGGRGMSPRFHSPCEHSSTEPYPCYIHFTHSWRGWAEANDGIDVICDKWVHSSAKVPGFHNPNIGLTSTRQDNRTVEPQLCIVLYVSALNQLYNCTQGMWVCAFKMKLCVIEWQVHLQCVLHTFPCAGSTPSPSEAAHTGGCKWLVATLDTPSLLHQPHPLWGPPGPAGLCRWWGLHKGTGWQIAHWGQGHCRGRRGIHHSKMSFDCEQ